ncbi:juvenile hormone esterase-like [Toxorhynchites rutilus septentrionalis]|uniref:juvenile hormone esterase-like n=1 Tax=Toxorhynchites rutilus septentrionalis TaxID=329112 RepID=UPI00247AAA08|nr:juvenile hormone esterase-like [Toxorhynchites rutilus septentrionalis]XP_055637018.1 juvenile hormone esterase-like [Toxorhynchites rutilus septentrionalis]
MARITLLTISMLLVVNSSFVWSAAVIASCSNSCGPAPAVKIQDGCLCGTRMNGLDKGPFEAFLGIPFAKPPVGALRFANPVRNDPWSGVYNASFPRNMCLQKNDFLPGATVQGTEDCLYLNVYRPGSIERTLPVMVFIHGGGYIAGSAHPALAGPEKFMDTRKVVLVTLQYRLGALGFLSTGDKAAPGNFGLKDQSMALRWVQENIRQFKGRPDQVTIFGQSSGASSCQLHMMSNLSKNLFSKAILQSGSALSYWNQPYGDPLELARKQVVAVGISSARVARMSTVQLVEVLRDVNANLLVSSVDKLKVLGVQPVILYRPVVESFVNESTFLSDNPKVLWAKGRYHKVPWMTGFLPNEGAAFSLGILSNSTFLEALIENAATYVPMMAAQPASVASLLNRRFFGGVPINSTNADGLSKMITESAFVYPMMNSVQQHLANGYNDRAPVALYYFNFKGRYSYAVLYTGKPPTKDYGVCHGDDLLYLFAQPVIFPDFSRDSPEAEMSRDLVHMFTRFAIKGNQDLVGKALERCNCHTAVNDSLKLPTIVEFTNSDNSYDLVKTDYVHEGDAVSNALKNILSWWSNLEKSVGSAA